MSGATFNGTRTINPSLFVDGLQITDNIMSNVSFGVKLTNIIGQQGNSVIPKDQTSINGNSIKFASTFTSNNIITDKNAGMQIYSCSGLTVVDNTIENTNSKYYKIWRNMGIESQNTGNTLIKYNKIKAGRGLAGSLSSIGNNYACNKFMANENGISLENHALRAKTDVHGIRKKESRENTFSNQGAAEIELYTTADPKLTPLARMNLLIYQNQWLFLGVPKVAIIPVPTVITKSIIAGTAPDVCGGESDNIDESQLVPADENNDAIDWQQNYEYVKQQKLAGEEISGAVSLLIDLQEAVSKGEYSNAQVILAAIEAEGSDDLITVSLTTIYGILIAAEMDDERLLNSAELASLIEIAQLPDLIFGPSVHLAKAILWSQEGLEFNTSVDMHPQIMVKLNYEPCLGELPIEEITSAWVDEAGTEYGSAEVVLDSLGMAYMIMDQEADPLPEDGLYAFRFTRDGVDYTSVYLSLSEWFEDNSQSVDLCTMNLVGSAPSKKIAAEKALTSAAVSIYPNPGNGVFSLSGLPDVPLFVKVVDISGKVVYDATLTDHILDLTMYTRGLYYIRLSDSNGNLVFKQTILRTN